MYSMTYTLLPLILMEKATSWSSTARHSSTQAYAQALHPCTSCTSSSSNSSTHKRAHTNKRTHTQALPHTPAASPTAGGVHWYMAGCRHKLCPPSCGALTNSLGGLPSPFRFAMQSSVGRFFREKPLMVSPVWTEVMDTCRAHGARVHAWPRMHVCARVHVTRVRSSAP